MKSGRQSIISRFFGFHLYLMAAAVVFFGGGLFLYGRRYLPVLKKIWSACQLTLANFFNGGDFYLKAGLATFFLILTAAFARGVLTIIRQFVFYRGFKRFVGENKINQNAKIRKIAKEFGLERRIVILKSKQIIAFVSGFLAPKIYLSTAVLNLLGREELKLVLKHEACHLKRRDPLKMFFCNLLSDILFFAPLLKDLNRNYFLHRELLADREAAGKKEERAFLAGALLKIMKEQKENFAYQGMAASHFSPAGERIKNILREGDFELTISFSSLRMFATVIFVISFFVVLFLPSVYARGNQAEDIDCRSLDSRFIYQPAENIFDNLQGEQKMIKYSPHLYTE